MSPLCRVEFQGAKAFKLYTIALAKRIIEDGSEAFSDGNKALSDEETTAFCSTPLPDLIFVIKNSDDAELSVSVSDCAPYNISDLDSQYPARFRISPTTLHGISKKECKERAQRFAVGSLIYRVMAGKPPFEDLDEGLVQQNFENGLYPVETMEYPLEIAISILGFWSQEFTEQFIKHILSADRAGVPGKIFEHIRTHPVSSGIAAVGLGLFGVASLVIPALGIAGFSALGPTAGSAAAAWHSSVGIAQAGSLFAWCQSAAMGGAAAGTIVAAQGVGGVVAGSAALGGILSGSKDEQAAKRMIWILFTESVRKVGGEDAAKT